MEDPHSTEKSPKTRKKSGLGQGRTLVPAIPVQCSTSQVEAGHCVSSYYTRVEVE